MSKLKSKQKLGKYRIERCLGEGGFAAVYQAMDTIEGMRVALKIPFDYLLTEDVLEVFRREVRLAARLKHPNILPIKNAEFIENRFVITFPLGERTLADRLLRRISLSAAIDLSQQMLDAVAHAHQHRIIHCDIKPENMILFPEHRLMLTDFGLAKVAMRTIRASGSGTIGYVAPEQAMGKPSLRSDVFSLGLVMHRTLAGQLPEWPFEWPPPGYDRLRSRAHPELIALLRRAIEVDPRKRFRDAIQMSNAFARIRSRALRYQPTGAVRASSKSNRRGTSARDWRTVRRRQFLQQYGRLLATSFNCMRCAGPVSECMQACPWCGADRSVLRDDTAMPLACPRCNRGLKRDWTYCPWCYGAGFEVEGKRKYDDDRYTARCSNADCQRKSLMPFMRYCPWCHRKVRRKWKVLDSPDTCTSCGWGVLPAFWSHCPWCCKMLKK